MENYYLRFETFTQSDSADGNEHDVPYGNVDITKFLHIYLHGVLQDSAAPVHGRYVNLNGGSYINFEFSLISTGSAATPSRWQYVLDHYVLDPNTPYRFQAALSFPSGELLCEQDIHTNQDT